MLDIQKDLPLWRSVIAEQQKQPYYNELQKTLTEQRKAGEIIFPGEKDVLSAFSYCDLNEIKVVILGQDPYHGAGDDGQSQAHGLAFSVNYGIKTPPSLVNIYKELTLDIDGFTTPQHGHLAEWAQQGVLLLNTVLTVKQGEAHSHAKLGWEQFTGAIINAINEKNSGCVFILWGSHAQKKGQEIDENKHCILAGPHPSPLSAYRGFFGCKHFSKANQWLMSNDKPPIIWQLSHDKSEVQQSLF